MLAVFTLQLDANENIDSFPIIYTMGPVSGGVLQPHDVRLYVVCMCLMHSL